jgi:hypothetical protein
MPYGMKYGGANWMGQNTGLELVTNLTRKATVIVTVPYHCPAIRHSVMAHSINRNPWLA